MNYSDLACTLGEGTASSGRLFICCSRQPTLTVLLAILAVAQQ